MKQITAAVGPVWLMAAGFLFASISHLAAAEPMEDVDYVLIAPQPVSIPGKIEVIEFFHYGCESCNRLEPQLQVWLKARSRDISFRRIPALRRTAWIPLTKLYYALEQLGEIERLHTRVYQAVHEGGINLGNAAELHTWARKSGIDGEKLEQMLDSDLIRTQVQAARDATETYRIRATPSFVVDGQYMTSGSVTGSLEALLLTVDGLIDKARAAHALQ